MPRELTDEIAARAELLDLGSGVGGSLRSAMRRFEAKGIGLELRPHRVARAQESGLDVFQANVLHLDPTQFPAVKYVVLDNVLEHLADLEAVANVLASAARLASRLVYVRHPSFEDTDYLESLGVRQYWTDWPGNHTAPIRVHEFVRIANELGLYHLVIRPVMRAHDTADSTILPITAPPHQGKVDRARFGAYDPTVHDEKPFVRFVRPVYLAYDLLFVTGDGRPSIAYQADPEHDPRRPRISWVDRKQGTDERGSARGRKGRRSGGLSLGGGRPAVG